MSIINNSLIIIPTHQPKKAICDFALQTASILSKNNNLVVYFFTQGRALKDIILDSIKGKKAFRYFSKEGGIYFFEKIEFLPFKRLFNKIRGLPFEKFNFISRINLIINIFILKTLVLFLKKNAQRKILWFFQPKDSVCLSFFKDYLLLYDGIDYYYSFDPQKNQLYRKQENLILENVDLMTVISHSLYNLYKKKRKDTFIVPQGFAEKEFKKYQSLKPPISLPKGKPLIGLIGGMNFRLDYQLLLELIKNNPSWNFIFIGPFQKDEEDIFVKTQKKRKKLFSFPNCYYFKSQPKKYLPSIISQFDISLIAYNIKIPFNRYCYPMKVFEYFFLRKPVVSTPIEELKRLQPLVKIAKDAKNFEREIKKILKSGWPKKYKKKQRKLAIENSWERKIEKISEIIANC